MHSSAPGALPVAVATAPGKVILFGEHAVVYGQPAVAVPVEAVVARAEVLQAAAGAGIECEFPVEERRPAVRAPLQTLRTAAGLGAALAESGALQAPADDPVPPLLRAIAAALAGAGLTALPEWSVRIESRIPTGRGMGSSAAVAVAAARAVRTAAGAARDPEAEAAAALHAERITHGTPSGIDTSVISRGRPIRFARDTGAAELAVGSPLHVVVADSGAPGRTRDMVAAVRERRARDPRAFDATIEAIGALVRHAVELLAAGDAVELGRLMDRNHALLQTLGVSTPALDRLVDAARQAGALGSKLSGSGGGGVVVALAGRDAEARRIEAALGAAGAPRTYRTTIARSAPAEEA